MLCKYFVMSIKKKINGKSTKVFMSVGKLHFVYIEYFNENFVLT